MSELDEFLAAMDTARDYLNSQRVGPLAADLRQALEALKARVMRRPRVVLLGEVNAGKSTLANALLGFGLLPHCVLHNTRIPIVLRHSDTFGAVLIADGGLRKRLDLQDPEILGANAATCVELEFPAPSLAAFDIVDTPGIATYRDLARLGLMERDIPVWCTVACQAWKDSERRIWEAVPPRSWRHAVLAVTNSDLLTERGDFDHLISRLKTQTAGLFTDVLLTGKPMEDDPSLQERWIGIGPLERRIGEIVLAKAAQKARVGQRLVTRFLRGAEKLKEMPATGVA